MLNPGVLRVGGATLRALRRSTNLALFMVTSVVAPRKGLT